MRCGFSRALSVVIANGSAPHPPPEECAAQSRAERRPLDSQSPVRHARDGLDAHDPQQLVRVGARLCRRVREHRVAAARPKPEGLSRSVSAAALIGTLRRAAQWRAAQWQLKAERLTSTGLRAGRGGEYIGGRQSLGENIATSTGSAMWSRSASCRRASDAHTCRGYDGRPVRPSTSSRPLHYRGHSAATPPMK